MAEFTHFDKDGNAQMVDVGGKKESARKAVASGWIAMSPEAYAKVKAGSMSKGDVLGVSRIAGIMAAKKTSGLIPLCHPLALSRVAVDFSLVDELHRIEIFATVEVTGKTGVEMEALTAVSVAALTIYDMCKAVDKTMVIGDIQLREKRGGKSGVFLRESEA